MLRFSNDYLAHMKTKTRKTLIDEDQMCFQTLHTLSHCIPCRICKAICL